MTSSIRLVFLLPLIALFGCEASLSQSLERSITAKVVEPFIDLTMLQAGCATYRTMTGRWPASIDELCAALPAGSGFPFDASKFEDIQFANLSEDRLRLTFALSSPRHARGESILSLTRPETRDTNSTLHSDSTIHYQDP